MTHSAIQGNIFHTHLVGSVPFRDSVTIAIEQIKGIGPVHRRLRVKRSEMTSVNNTGKLLIGFSVWISSKGDGVFCCSESVAGEEPIEEIHQRSIEMHDALLTEWTDRKNKTKDPQALADMLKKAGYVDAPSYQAVVDDTPPETQPAMSQRQGYGDLPDGWYWIETAGEERSLVKLYTDSVNGVRMLGFNRCDGGGFLPLNDLMPTSNLTRVEIVPAALGCIAVDPPAERYRTTHAIPGMDIPGAWWPSKSVADAVVCGDPPPTNSPKDNVNDMHHYGGFLVAESIRSDELRRLISMAPVMSALLLGTLRGHAKAEAIDHVLAYIEGGRAMDPALADGKVGLVPGNEEDGRIFMDVLRGKIAMLEARLRVVTDNRDELQREQNALLIHARQFLRENPMPLVAPKGH